MTLSQDLLNNLMDIALAEAELAFAENEVPVGAVIAKLGKDNNLEILARNHNRVEQRQSPTAHAEILVIEEAAKKNQNWRLTNSILVVTLEPCAMCASAIRLARIPTVVFGATDNRLGALGSLFDLGPDPRLGPPLRAISNIKDNECKTLLQQFFKQRRADSAS